MISPKIDQKNIERAKELIEGADRITIICHTGPDGDAIGSSLAAAHVLSAIGKRTQRSLCPILSWQTSASFLGAKRNRRRC